MSQCTVNKNSVFTELTLYTNRVHRVYPEFANCILHFKKCTTQVQNIKQSENPVNKTCLMHVHISLSVSV